MPKRKKLISKEQVNSTSQTLPPQLNEPFEQGSKDNFKPKQRSKDDFGMKYQPPPVVEEVKPSRISRFVSSIMDSKLGKVLFGSALSRAITITFTTALLSGVFPPAIPFALTAAFISLSAVGVSAIVDTVRTRSLRKLAEESDLLVRNRTALSKQEYILKNLSPELSDTLKDQLHRPNLQQQDNNNYYVGTGKAANLGQMVLDTAPSAANFVLHSMLAASTGNPMAIVKALNSGTITATTLIAGGAGAKYMVGISTALKLHINEERQHTKPYKDIAQLRANVEKQEIQTLALQKLLQEKDYFKLTDPKVDPQQKQINEKELQTRFERFTAEFTEHLTKYRNLTPQEKQERPKQLSAEFEEIVKSSSLSQQEKQEKFKQLNKVLQKDEIIQKIAHPVIKQSDSILSDIGRAHDPFYVQPTRKSDSELTKAMVKEKQESAKEKAKESAKKILPSEIRHFVSPHLDVAETRVQKVKTQIKSKPVKAKAQDR